MDNKLPFDIDNYHRVFKKYPKSLMQSGDRVYGVWLIGNYYKRKENFHGEYPPSFLERIYALFPNRESVLHLFSGTIKDGKTSTTVDINPDRNPTIVCDVKEVSNYLESKSFQLVIADPPYSKKDAKIYGVPLVNKRLALREARKVTEDGGILIWLDLQTPIYRKIDWNLLGMIGISCGTNRAFRVATIFQATSVEEEHNEQLVESGEQDSKSNDSDKRGRKSPLSRGEYHETKYPKQTLTEKRVSQQIAV
jgi:hypothetical protein